MPCFAEDRGKQILQIDGVTRENSQAGIDERIRIEKTTCKAAIKIRLQPDTVHWFTIQKATIPGI